MVGLSFRLAAVKGLRKKVKRSKVEARAKRSRRALSNSDSRPVAVAVAVAVAVQELPEDVLIDILARLPANSLMRFKCVSRLWFSIISSRYFTNLFRNSPLRGRRLFLYLVDKDGHGDYSLHSTLPDNLGHKFYQLDQDLTIPGMGGCFVNALRGLMCSRIGRRVMICNLTTKQHVELPLVRSSILGHDDSNMWNHFEYDPIQDEYRVLSLAWEMRQERVVRSEHQVLVLGRGASWRRITQSVEAHRPYSQGISIDGVLYYGAWTGENTCVVVSFDMRSEKCNLIKLPFEAGIVWDTRATNLMNYKGKLGVFDYSSLVSECRMDMWVLEEDARKSQWWNKKTLVLPISEILDHILTGELLVQGTSREGKIRWFIRNYSSWHLHIIYDLESCKIEGRVISGQLLKRHSEPESLHTNYWDDFESIMYLEA